MDDDIFEIYISDLKFTEPARILRYSTKAETVVEHVEPVQVQELLTLLRSKDQQQPRIKTEDTLYGNLLVIEGVGAEELPIRMERAVFLDLLAHMQIPRIFVRSMTDHGGHYSTFINHEERDGQLRPESIFATPVAKWRMFSCCLRIHLVNSEVSGIILHSNVGAIKRVPRLFQGRQKDLAMSPVSFLVFLLEMFGLETTLHSTYLAEDIRKAEEKTGFWEDMNSTIVASKYEQLNKDVYSCRLRLSSLRRFTDFQQEFGQFLHKFFDLIDQLRTECGLGPESKWKRIAVVQDLDYQVTTCRRLQAEWEKMHERIQIQIDVVSAAITYEYTTSC